MIKVSVPRMLLKIIDDAIQAHGGGGVSEDAGLARMYAQSRTLRLADGPDEVHNRSIARMEIARHGSFTPKAH
jgi:alkylation response protein AidB-like acyl-CoA dehydrogenase